MWSYVHFAIYLDTVHPNEHNALEKYVFERVSYIIITCIHNNIAYQLPDPSKKKPGNIEFYPLRMAKVLPNNALLKNDATTDLEGKDSEVF